MNFAVQVGSRKSFEILQGQTIWAAADIAGMTIPYSCLKGRCSTCRCKVIKGESLALQDESGLSVEERAQGWILSCVRVAKTDLELEVEELGGFTLPSVVTLPARIHTLERLASDVLRVVLRLPPNAEFNFIPGQYIDVIGPAGIRRSYSLANSSFNNKQLELHIRAVDGGVMSEYWFGQAKVNDLLRLNGPLGTFFLRDIKDLDLIFLATGTGFAPIKAMLESIAGFEADQQPRSVTVFWGGRTEHDFYMDLPSVSLKFRFVPVLSRAEANWSGAHGHVQHVLLSLQSDLSKAVVYACGSDAMIQGAKNSLTMAGLPTNRFYSDAFVCSASS